MRGPSSLDTAVQEWLRFQTPIPKAVRQAFDPDEPVEIGYVPGLSKTNTLDAHWVHMLPPHARVGVHLEASPALGSFFELINVDPRQIFTDEDLKVQPCPPREPGDKWPAAQDAWSLSLLAGYLELCSFYRHDPARAQLLSVAAARRVYDNCTCGGVPMIAGYVSWREVMSLRRHQTIQISGRPQVGIHDNANGSGYLESVEIGDSETDERPVTFNITASRGDFVALKTKGWSPDQSAGFARWTYSFDLTVLPKAVCANAPSAEAHHV